MQAHAKTRSIVLARDCADVSTAWEGVALLIRNALCFFEAVPLRGVFW